MMSDIDENLTITLNGGAITISVKGYSGDGCIIAPCLEINTQINGSTFNHQSIHLDVDSIEEIGHYLLRQASLYKEMGDGATPHPFHLTVNKPYEDNNDE